MARHLEPNSSVQVNAKVTKSAHFCLHKKFALRKKNRLDNFYQVYIYINLARDPHINVKKLGVVTVLIFPEKRKIDPKIVIFVLLRAIVSQKRNNATV